MLDYAVPVVTAVINEKKEEAEEDEEWGRDEENEDWNENIGKEEREPVEEVENVKK